jgi:hypothetical protein
VTAYGLGVGIVCAPFISALLLGLRRGGRALTRTARQTLRQAHGYTRWCLPRGHLWTGRSDEHPNWRGVCVTCGKVAASRPSWRRFILMGDCAPTVLIRREHRSKP